MSKYDFCFQVLHCCSVVRLVFRGSAKEIFFPRDCPSSVRRCNLGEEVGLSSDIYTLLYFQCSLLLSC